MPLQTGPCSWAVKELLVGGSGAGRVFSTGGQLFFSDAITLPVSLNALSGGVVGSNTLQDSYDNVGGGGPAGAGRFILADNGAVQITKSSVDANNAFEAIVSAGTGAAISATGFEEFSVPFAVPAVAPAGQARWYTDGVNLLLSVNGGAYAAIGTGTGGGSLGDGYNTATTGVALSGLGRTILANAGAVHIDKTSVDANNAFEVLVAGGTGLAAQFSGASVSCPDAFFPACERFGLFALTLAAQCSAFGTGAAANGTESTAIGRSASATTFCTAIGANADAGIAIESTAVGRLAQAWGANSVALGNNAAATGANATALGKGSGCTFADCVAVGHIAGGGAIRCVAVGALASTSFSGDTSVGYQALASGGDCVAVGRQANAINPRSVAIGGGAVGSGIDCISIGMATGVGGNGSSAVGRGSTDGGEQDACILGSFNTITAAATRPICIGTGITFTAAAIMTVAIGNNGLLPGGGNCVAIGSPVTISGIVTNSVAIGRGASIGGSSSVAIGDTAGVGLGGGCVSIGAGTNANQLSTVVGAGATGGGGPNANCCAFGNGATVTGNAAIAIGSPSSALSNNSTAIGDSAIVNAGTPNSIAIGSGATVAAAIIGGVIAIGFATVGGAPGATAVGNSANASGLNSVSLGIGAVTTGLNGVALGANASDGGFANSVALGQGATCTAANQFVCGSGSSFANVVRFLGNTAANLGSVFEFTDGSLQPVSAVTECRLRYFNGTGLQVSYSGAAYVTLATGGAATLQSAYVGGNTIDITAGARPVTITNAGGFLSSLLSVTGSAAVVTTVVSFSGSGGSPGFTLGVSSTGATGSAVHFQTTGAVNPDPVVLATAAGAAATGVIFRGRSIGGSTACAILEGTNGATAAVSAAGEFRLRYNSVTPTLEVSYNGAAYVTLGGGGGSLNASYLLGNTIAISAGARAVAISNAGAFASSLLTLTQNAGVATTTMTISGGTGRALDVTGGTGISTTTGITSPGAGASSEKFGQGSLAAGASSVAVGNGCSCVGVQGVNIGATSTMSGTNAVAVGFATTLTAGATSSVGVGFGATITTADCVGIGNGASVSGANSTAIGSGVVVGQAGSIALGRAATTTLAGQCVIGGSGFGITLLVVGNGVANAAPAGFTLKSTAGTGAVNGSTLTISPGDAGAIGNRSGACIIATRTAGGALGAFQNQIVATGGVGGFGRLALGRNVASETLGSGVEVQGTSFGVSTVITTAANPYVVTDDDFCILYGTVGGAITLLSPVGRTGRIVMIRHNAGAGNVTITPAAGLIDGAATLVLTSVAANDSAILVSDGANWWQLAHS